jgi:hypothetical protein
VKAHLKNWSRLLLLLVGIAPVVMAQAQTFTILLGSTTADILFNRPQALFRQSGPPIFPHLSSLIANTRSQIPFQAHSSFSD